MAVTRKPTVAMTPMAVVVLPTRTRPAEMRKCVSLVVRAPSASRPAIPAGVDADVLVDGVETSKLTASDDLTLPAGEHTLTMRRVVPTSSRATRLRIGVWKAR